ncbi:MAG: hypothetical protein DI539_12880 [Flavobacterium psychrophilum]|nr:MAG: hypothetical protein DI539_12880 [Flavobacterium psychrophilum]
MKKILSLLVLVTALVSCEEDVKFNNPAVQGLKDNELWKATTYDAKKTGNTIIINAHRGGDFETMTITLNAAAPGSVHNLGLDELNKGSYSYNIDGISESFTTGTGKGNGRVTIMGEDDNNINGTGGKGFISGSFYFNAYNSDDSGVVNFQQGVFYRVPLTVEP